jgi:hypothetical protein
LERLQWRYRLQEQSFNAVYAFDSGSDLGKHHSHHRQHPRGRLLSIHGKRFRQFQHGRYLGCEWHVWRFICDRNNIFERQLHGPRVAPEP